MLAPVQVIALALAGAVSYYVWTFTGGDLFSRHPILMNVGLFACTSNAIYYYKKKRDHKMHMILQLMGVACMDMGLYFMYMVKESKGKAHWWTMEASSHAWGGAFIAALFNLMAVAMTLTTPPGATAAIRANGPGHVVGGRVAFAGAMSVCISGFNRGPWAEDKLAVLAYACGVGAVAMGLLSPAGWKMLRGGNELLKKFQ